jgi:hypothetical protein
MGMELRSGSAFRVFAVQRRGPVPDRIFLFFLGESSFKPALRDGKACYTAPAK